MSYPSVRACSAALLALACNQALAQQPAPPDGATPAMVKEGKKLYEGRGLCIACHGPAGRGGVGPDLTDREWWHGDGSYPAIVQQVREGIPVERSRSGTPMPPKGGSSLNESELRAVAAYVHSLRTVVEAGGGGRRPAPLPPGSADAMGPAGFEPAPVGL